jgi:hypothetical protein
MMRAGGSQRALLAAVVVHVGPSVPVVLTQFALLVSWGATSAGRFALVVAWATPGYLFAGLGARSVLVVDRSLSPRGITEARFVVGAAVTAVTAVCYLAVGSLAGSATDLGLLFLVSCVRWLDGLGEVAAGVLIGAGRHGRAAVSVALRSLGGSAAALMIVAVADSLYMLVAFQCVVAAVCSVVIDRRFWWSAASDHEPRRSHRVVIIRDLLPLGAGAMCASLAFLLPRLALDVEHDTRAVGLFAAWAVVALTASGLLSGVLDLWLAPRLQDRPGARQAVARMLGVAYAVALVSLVGWALITAVFSSASDVGQVAPLVLATGMSVPAALQLAVLLSLRRYRALAVVNLIGAGLVALTSWPAVIAIGPAGAAWTIVVGRVGATACSGWLLLRGGTSHPTAGNRADGTVPA